MSYEFPPKTETGNLKVYKNDLANLTRSNKDDPKTGFCDDLRGRISAFDFDGIKDDFCSVRQQRYGGAKLKSVDAFFKAADGTLYFFEFKKSSREALEVLDDDGERIPFEVSLKRKAVDSLAVSALTVLQDKSGAEICDHAVLFVVYRKSVTDTLGSLEINSGLTSLAGGADSISKKHSIMWSLDELRKKGLYKDVHTWPEDEFVSWAKENVK